MTDGMGQRWTWGVEGLANVWQQDRIRELEEMLHQRDEELASLRRRMAQAEAELVTLRRHRSA